MKHRTSTPVRQGTSPKDRQQNCTKPSVKKKRRPHVNPRREILAYLRLLWPNGVPDDGEITLFEMPSLESRHFGNLEDAAREAARIDNGLKRNGGSLYLGMGATRAGLAAGQKGRAQDIVAIPGLWADIDFLTDGHSALDYPTREEALAMLGALPLQPTELIDSGGGYYPLWLFAEPWVLSSNKDRHAATRLLTGWQAAIRAWLNGKRVDSTANLDRVLRAPGTRNRKYEGDPFVFVVEHDEECRYDPRDFTEWISFGDGHGSNGERSRAVANGTTAHVLEASPHVRLAIEALARLGISSEEVHDRDGKLETICLDLCPACDGVQKDGRIEKRTSYIGPTSGVLRCHRESCDASGGILFDEWVEWFDEDDAKAALEALDAERRKAPPLYPPDTIECTLDEFQHVYATLLDGVREHEATGGIALITVTTSSGKTTAEIDQMERKRAYFAQSHMLLKEPNATLEERGAKPQRAVGMHEGCTNEHVKQFVNAGIADRAMCEKCDRKSTCIVWESIDPSGGPILAAHANLPHLYDLKVEDRSGDKVALMRDRPVTIDECPQFVDTTVLIRNDALRAARLDTRRLIGTVRRKGKFSLKKGRKIAETLRRATDVLRAILDACAKERNQRGCRGKYATYFHGHDLKAIIVAQSEVLGFNVSEFFKRAAAIGPNDLQRPASHKVVEGKIAREEILHPKLYRAWRAINVLLHGGDTRTTVDVVATDQTQRIEVRAPWTVKTHAGGRVLDATGFVTLPLLQAANPNTDIRTFPIHVQPSEDLELRKLLIETSSANRRKLLSKRKIIRKRAWGLLRNVLREIAKRLAALGIDPSTVSVAIITHAPIAGALSPGPDATQAQRQRAAELRRVVETEGRGTGGIRIDPKLVGYYGRDDRGTNAFEGVDVLITLGDPWPDIGASKADARFLKLDDVDEVARLKAFTTLEQAHGRARFLRATGPRFSVHVGRLEVPSWKREYDRVPLPGNEEKSAGEWKPAQIRAYVEQLVHAGIPIAAPLIRVAIEVLHLLARRDTCAAFASEGSAAYMSALKVGTGRAPSILPSKQKVKRAIDEVLLPSKTRWQKICVPLPGNWIAWAPPDWTVAEAEDWVRNAWGQLHAVKDEQAIKKLRLKALQRNVLAQRERCPELPDAV